MSSEIKVTNIKANDGTAGLVIADSTGQVKGTLGSATVFPAGHIIQVVSAPATSAQVTVNSTSFNTDDVIGNCQITPKKASSNILIMASITAQVNSTGSYIYLDIYKNASDVTETVNLSGRSSGIAVNDDSHWVGVPVIFLDTCAENSLTEKTYKISGRINSGGGQGYLGWTTDTSFQEHITAWEIAT